MMEFDMDDIEAIRITLETLNKLDFPHGYYCIENAELWSDGYKMGTIKSYDDHYTFEVEK